MRASTRVAGLLALGGLAAALLWIRSQRLQLERARTHATAAIRAVIDTTRDDGWVETFEGDRAMPLSELDRRWRPLFGQVLTDPRRGAVGDPQGGWQRDGGDDYVFRVTDTPTGDVVIVADGWWDGIGSLGVQGMVQAEPPHRLYEAAIWRGKLALVYFIGPGPDQYEILAESADLKLGSGNYRLVLCIRRAEAAWQLKASVREPGADFRVLATVSASDGRLGKGGQGIGMLGGGGPQSSFFRGLAVRNLDAAADSAPPDALCDK